ncbi:hypothetical protein DIPPA_06086 [Diplonema papillatum]|nr:hypothetical protein DIPPA_06086 [Diplonema papillatum]
MFRIAVVAAITAAAEAQFPFPLPPLEPPGPVPQVNSVTSGGAPLPHVTTEAAVVNPVAGEKWTGVPSYMVGGKTTFVTRDAGTPISLTCNDVEATCLFVIAVFRCNLCSLQANGGLPALLLEREFESGSCGPTLHVNGGTWSSNVFRRFVSYQQPVELVLPKEVRYAVVFGKTMVSACDHSFQVYCTPDGLCTWNDATGTCSLEQFCPINNAHGPSLDSSCTCPWM